MNPENILDFFSPKKKDGKKDGKSVHEAVIPPDKVWLKIIISLVITAAAGALLFYFMLPALNPKSLDLYIYIGVLLAVYVGATFLTSGAAGARMFVPYVKKQSRIPAIIAIILGAVVLVGLVSSAVVFRASSYKELLNVKEGTFSSDIEEVDFNTVPMLDRTAAEKLGERQIGTLSDMVSQFVIQNDYYNQINYKDHPVRVTTLMYADPIKWLTNRSEGLPAYVLVDMITQKVDIVRMPEGQGIKYSPAEHFGRLLQRHLRMNYPTFIFDTPAFEIDETGHPYWICPRLDKTIGLFGGTDAVGVVIVDAVTGDSSYHDIESLKSDPEMQWIDRVYSSAMLLEQYDYHGKLQNGFINSIIGQKGVKITTEGYNYLALNDDVYLYTGVTSITSDQSIVGFLLVNQRTKEATFYQQAGAKEYSAEESAEGAVQQYRYTSTFPLLLNISGQPTYFMALKDNSDIVKMYAMVNVEQWSVGTATGKTVEECLANYVALMEPLGIKINDKIEVPEEDKTSELIIEGAVADIRTAVIDGNSVYYIKLDAAPNYYSVAAKDAPDVIIANKGDMMKITAEKSGLAIAPAKKAELVKPEA